METFSSSSARITEEAKFLFTFLRYLLRQKKVFVIAVLCLVTDTLSRLLVPLVIKEFLDSPDILSFVIKFSLIVIVSASFRYLFIHLTNMIGQKALYQIRSELFSHILKLRVSFFDKSASGKLVSRITSDVENMNELFVSGLIVFVADVLAILGIVIVMFILDAKLAFVSCAFLPFMLMIVFLFRKRISRIYLLIRRKVAELNSFSVEVLTGIKTVKIIPAYLFSVMRFRELTKSYSDEVDRSATLVSLFFSSIMFFSSLSLASILMYGGIEIIHKNISFGTFIAFWYAVNELYNPIWDFSEKYNIFQMAVASARRIKEITDEPEENHSEFSTFWKLGSACGSVKGEIEFQNVEFSYDGKKDVLKGVSFVVEAGERVSIVGPSGSGKTTLANLMTRMYEPKHGRILLDGRDIREYPIRFVRRNICFVHQDIFIFSGTVLENITLERYEESSLKRLKMIKDMLKDLGLEAFMYKRISQESGLSAGEKQMISIFRAIYNDPKIIILDEATAFLDLEVERKLSDIMKTFWNGRTLMKIAHRLSTALSSDKIIFMQDGRARTFGRDEFLASGLWHGEERVL